MLHQITIQTTTGPQSIAAERYGKFSIHRTTTISGTENTYTVTHTRSGIACAVCLSSRVVALKLARRLTAARLNWNFTTADKMSKKASRAAGRIVGAILTSDK